jgi:hypothetical protein
VGKKDAGGGGRGQCFFVLHALLPCRAAGSPIPQWGLFAEGVGFRSNSSSKCACLCFLESKNKVQCTQQLA